MPTIPPKESAGASLPLDSKSEAKALAKTEQTIPEQVARRGINESQWRTLCSSLYPGANPNSVLMVIDYCRARNLDPMKRPCHIVPMEVTVKTSSGERKEWRDVVLPGIYELRTTAQRTGEYLGHPEPRLSPPQKQNGVVAPESCTYTVWRWNPKANVRAEFPVVVYFREVVATKSGGEANARWRRAPIQMLTKCAEAAALREAFPDELGGQMTEEEMEGQRHPDVVAQTVDPGVPKPDGYDKAIETLADAATKGAEAFGKAWQAAGAPVREYLTRTDAEYFETLKGNAEDVDIAAADQAADKGGET